MITNDDDSATAQEALRHFVVWSDGYDIKPRNAIAAWWGEDSLVDWYAGQEDDDA